jgi:hypothetical protein
MFRPPGEDYDFSPLGVGSQDIFHDQGVPLRVVNQFFEDILNPGSLRQIDGGTEKPGMDFLNNR